MFGSKHGGRTGQEEKQNEHHHDLAPHRPSHQNKAKDACRRGQLGIMDARMGLERHTSSMQHSQRTAAKPITFETGFIIFDYSVFYHDRTPILNFYYSDSSSTLLSLKMTKRERECVILGRESQKVKTQRANIEHVGAEGCSDTVPTTTRLCWKVNVPIDIICTKY
jgi:hypothetical protein